MSNCYVEFLNDESLVDTSLKVIVAILIMLAVDMPFGRLTHWTAGEPPLVDKDFTEALSVIFTYL